MRLCILFSLYLFERKFMNNYVLNFLTLDLNTKNRSKKYFENLTSIKGGTGIPLKHNAIFFSIHSTKTNQKPKMGAEKVTMNIVVVGQVQSAKAIKSVAKATPATSQFMVKQLSHEVHMNLKINISIAQTVHNCLIC
ncbi:Uncharacterized protein FWK35_00004681 [Aphis craccivora]|uniref:Uncharacterized protein n=1 Tax=Aphis craccivora TaxID=307492 RepID=A0A6G0YXV1_APHCR|nr:Uncharacterized protein FWK35_00004681 [Aphis craccivora]